MTVRRKFLRNSLLLGISAPTLLRTRSLLAQSEEIDASRIKGWPPMQYKTLGRTNFKASRLMYGCGAALSRKKNDQLLQIAFDAGINVFDVGTSRFYGNAERNLADFVEKHRDDIFLISKSFLNASESEEPSVERAKEVAQQWRKDMEQSLTQLKQEHVDAYYTMDAKNPAFVKSEELFREFERAKQDGKVSYFGLSTHNRAAEVLAAAAETDWYHLAMVAITPAGWYDWNRKAVLPDSPPMVDLKPALEDAKRAGIALVGMKVARHLAPRLFGRDNAKDLYDSHYSEKLKKSEFSVFQKSYAYVLEHGMDVVNSDIQNIDILEENFLAAATSREYLD